MKTMQQVAVAMVALGALHCGASTPATTGTDAGSTTPVTCSGTVNGTTSCWDVGGSGDIMGAATSLCQAPLGSPAPGACTRTGIVGGCRVSLGTVVATNWLYAGTTAQVMMVCSGIPGGATYVTP